MIRFEELIPVARRALTHARRPEREQIADAIKRAGVVRVFGEAEVGTTSLLAHELRNPYTIRIDLDGVSGPGDVAWLISRGLTRQLIGAGQLSQLHGPAGLRSPSTRRALVTVQKQLGIKLVDLALADGPIDKDSDAILATAMEAVERQAVAGGELTIWVDHLEAPGLTPRHPVSVRRLLWELRSIRQRESSVQLVVSGRAIAQKLADDEDGALHGDGLLMRVQRPSEHVWQQVAGDLSRVAGGRATSRDVVADLCALTDGHPSTMLLALCDRASGERVRASGEAQLLDLATHDDGHAARAMQHARTLHRLGGQVLIEVAHGRKPYRQPGLGSRPQEINRSLQRLHQAGLITHHGHGAWSVSNPLTAIRLRGLLRPEPEATDALDQSDSAAARYVNDAEPFSRVATSSSSLYDDG